MSASSLDNQSVRPLMINGKCRRHDCDKFKKLPCHVNMN
jgi:hypothetical protein